MVNLISRLYFTIQPTKFEAVFVAKMSLDPSSRFLIFMANKHIKILVFLIFTMYVLMT